MNDARAMVECAVQGLGLAYVMQNTARPHLASGALKRVLPAVSPTLPGLHLYYPSRRQLPPKLRCFVDFMAARNTRKAIRKR